MAGFARYAIYYAPPADSALWRFGSAWLGWDAEAGEAPPRPEIPGLPAPAETLTGTPRRYGFHGTLKPPFALAEDCAPQALETAAEALAAALAPFEAPPLRLSALGSFLALIPSADSPGLRGLAAACVRELDGFRAPPSEAELAKRAAPGLTPAQEANLARWGYPWVMDEFRFHLTLTGALEPEAREATRRALAPHVAPLCAAPLPVREIALCGDPGGGAPFRLLRRLPLGG
ncbi:MAG: DUF1045 domain-containing protein [Pseudomonadota bacterium]